jgi:acetoin utilization protein AcuB
MLTETEQLVASLEPLTLRAFGGFCEDISSMFGNTAACSADSVGQGTLSDLKKEFKKLASVSQVQTQGVLDGQFQLIVDQAGLFVLAGTLVMLPENRIMETIRGGTMKDADYINDAIKEAGNLLVGSWDRIFREELTGHAHLKLTGTFIGSIWDNPVQSVGLELKQPCHYVLCKMKVDDFPEFKFAAVFSNQLFDPKDRSPETPEVEPRDNAASQTEEQDAAATPETPAGTQQEKPVPTDAQTTDNELTSIASVLDQQTPVEAVSQDPAGIEQAAGPVTEAIHHLTQSAVPTVNAAANPFPAGLPTMTAEEIMNRAVIWVDPEESVETVLGKMQQHNVGYVLVGSDKELFGIVSRKDVASAVSPYMRPAFANFRRPLDDATLKIRIKWFMTRPVLTIRPDASLVTVMETMMRHSVRGLPVLDPQGKTLGLITVYDILGALLTTSGVAMTGQPQQTPSCVD